VSRRVRGSPLQSSTPTPDSLEAQGSVTHPSEQEGKSPADTRQDLRALPRPPASSPQFFKAYGSSMGLVLEPPTPRKHSTAQHSASELYEKTLNQTRHPPPWRSVRLFNAVQVETSRDVGKGNRMRALSRQVATFLRIEEWAF